MSSRVWGSISRKKERKKEKKERKKIKAFKTVFGFFEDQALVALVTVQSTETTQRKLN